MVKSLARPLLIAIDWLSFTVRSFGRNRTRVAVL
jgi:hypothetical protein